MVNPTKAFPTPHPHLLKFYTNSPQTAQPIPILQNIYESFATPWPFIALSVFVTLLICLYAHILWRKIKKTNKTTIHMELTTGTECILIRLLTLPLCPDNWKIKPPQDIHNINICRSCLLWADLSLDAPNFIIKNTHTKKRINIPTTIKITPLKALKLRKLLSQPYTAYFLISHHQYFRLLQ